MQVNGELHFIDASKQVTDNFTKRDFVLIINQNTAYPQYIKMELTQARCSIIDKFKAGDIVSVDFNLKGNLDREDPKKAYTKLEAWKIEKV